MSKDYKAGAKRGGGRGNGSSLLAGILIGLVLGLGIALAVAWYINKMPNPFSSRTPPSKSEVKAPAPAPQTQTARTEDKGAGKTEEKPRFDFYKILPGEETEKQGKDPARGSTAEARDAFFLQAGAFQNAPDADNLKARLALLGIEANIETSTVPDKGVMHRVRIGPYTNVEELNRTRDTLKQNGVQTTLVKQREP